MIKWIFIVVAIFMGDQFSKQIILNKVRFGQEIEVIPSFFYITHLTNKGAAWGILRDQRLLLLTITLVAMAFLLYLFKNNASTISRLSVVIIAGGAMGNFFDRLFRKDGVVDFLQVYLGSYAYPAFNVADSCIVIGTALFLFHTIFEKRKEG